MEGQHPTPNIERPTSNVRERGAEAAGVGLAETHLATAPELPWNGRAAELPRSAALTPLQRGQTKADDHFRHPVVAPVEAT